MNRGLTRLEGVVVEINGTSCHAMFGRYGNGRIAIALVERDTDEDMYTATTNMPDYPLADDEVCIKDYSENRGVLDAMVAAGIVEPTGRSISSGYVDIPICKLRLTP